jgi:hypothetical protein
MGSTVTEASGSGCQARRSVLKTTSWATPGSEAGGGGDLGGGEAARHRFSPASRRWSPSVSTILPISREIRQFSTFTRKNPLPVVNTDAAGVTVTRRRPTPESDTVLKPLSGTAVAPPVLRAMSTHEFGASV